VVARTTTVGVAKATPVLMSVPPATEMFQFAGFASPSYGFRRRSPLREGLPHSEIPGSPIARISPGLFAACHVLHRLSVPRHPPDALCFALDHRIASRRCRTTAAHRAKPRRRPRMKTLLSDTPGASAARATLGRQRRWRHADRRSFAPPIGDRRSFASPNGARCACLRPVRLGHTTTLCSPFNQPAAAVARGGVARSSPNVAAPPRHLPVVEVNGFEPMTSCLQSRRSPS
jgi:hypothetical protein